MLDTINEIDTNHDGYVSSGEVQGYILQSKIENRKIDDMQKMINKTSMFYGDDNASDTGSSLLSYKWLQEQNSQR